MFEGKNLLFKNPIIKFQIPSWIKKASLFLGQFGIWNLKNWDLIILIFVLKHKIDSELEGCTTGFRNIFIF
mgnify:FL=1